MLKISFAGCLGLYPATSSQFTFGMCTATKNCKKLVKPLFGGFKVVQGHRCW